MRLIREMGANGVRLVRQQLVELIRQNYNHPSIFTWSLYNELNSPTKAISTPLIEELNILAHHEDPTRPTTGAASGDTIANLHEMVAAFDLISVNLYPGWYGGAPDTMEGGISKWNPAYGARGFPSVNTVAARACHSILDPQQARDCKTVDLASKVVPPDVLVQPHMASLGMTFYTPGSNASLPFPAEFTNDAFAAEHGSWNRAKRGGYEVVRIPMRNGQANGSYLDFLTGFVTPEGQVWGQPVDVAMMKDGSILVTDDASRTVWRVVSSGNEDKVQSSSR